MPLRNVATNYTFEQQRQEINLLAADVDTLDTSVTALQGLQATETSDSPTFTNLTLSGYLAGPATLTIDPAAVGDNTGTVVIAGNLQVDGTTTTINSTTMTVDDLNITLASGAANAAAANGAGLTVDGANATLNYNGTTDEWEFNKSLRLSANLFCTNVEPSNNIQLVDTKKIIIGNDGDLEIEHTGSGSFIRTSTTSAGDLAIEARGSDHDLYLTAADDIFIRPQGGEAGITVIGDGAVELYHNNFKKFETTSTGAQVTGELDVNHSVYCLRYGAQNGGGRVDNTNKEGRLVQQHYTNAEEPLGTVVTFSQGSSSFVNIGGGSSLVNAATETSLYAAANTTTTGGTKILSATISGVAVTGTISDSMGPLRRLGANTQSGAYTLVAGDAGKYVAQASNSASVTVPNGVFSAGDMVTIVNLTATNINIVQGSGLDLNFTADGTTGTRTLGAKGACTILFVSSGTSFISGSGLS